MQTHFLSAERATPKELEEALVGLAGHPVLNALLKTAGGLLAVLNEHRQTLLVNHAYLDFLGVPDPEDILGLRPGEAVRCIHAQEMPGGCGTAPACASCGAAIALALALEGGETAEKTCCMEVDRGGAPQDLYLKVRVTPFSLEGRKVLLLFLEDVSGAQRRATLERMFFHDMNNLVHALLGNSELMARELHGQGREECAQQIHQLTLRLAREVEIQQAFAKSTAADLKKDPEEIDVHKLLGELCEGYTHRAAEEEILLDAEMEPGLRVETDRPLLLRILSNMVTNALEASTPGQKIRLTARQAGECVCLEVWNPTPIPPAVALRVFQRNFSTKGDLGRGLGTYSMKLFGETVLGGKVAFTSSPEAGTRFSILLPALSPGAIPLNG